MWKLILFSCTSILAVAASPEAKREVFYAGDISPASCTPTFDNGYLAAYDLDSGVLVYAPDGSLAFRFSPPRENAVVVNVAVDADGAAALAVEGPPGRGGISVVDPKGVQLRWIDTGDYVPSGLSFAPDHSLWTTGSKPELLSARELPEYEILRHYSQDGRELGRYLPRSSFAQEFPAGSGICPSHVIRGLWELRVAGGRVGVILAGRDGHLWVETDLSGGETGRWRLEGHPSAITADGTVYASTAKGILALDRESGQWRPTAVRVPDGILLGAQGKQLVFAIRGEKHLVWVPAN
jgi:outer membrane protein assembly factor BamB